MKPAAQKFGQLRVGGVIVGRALLIEDGFELACQLALEAFDLVFDLTLNLFFELFLFGEPGSLFRCKVIA